MSEIRGTDLVVMFGLGVAVGAATALLVAPASGEETRRRIGEFAKDASGRTREGVQRVAGLVKDQTDRVGRAIDQGKEAYQHERAG